MQPFLVMVRLSIGICWRRPDDLEPVHSPRASVRLLARGPAVSPLRFASARWGPCVKIMIYRRGPFCRFNETFSESGSFCISARSHPATLKSGFAKTLNNGGAPLHQSPKKFRAVILDHDHDWPLIQPIIPFGNPTAPFMIFTLESRIKTAFEAEFAGNFGVDFIEMLQRRQHNLGREGK